MVKAHHHTSVLEMDNGRKLFANHSLQLNGAREGNAF
jgi:hypothetical protein